MPRIRDLTTSECQRNPAFIGRKCRTLLSASPTLTQRMAQPDQPNDADAVPDDNQVSGADSADHVEGSKNLPETREERLRRIKANVDAGHYDSDELLDQAMELMIRRMSDDSE